MDVIHPDDDSFVDLDLDLDFMPDEYYDEYYGYEEDQEPQVLPRCGLCLFKFEQSDSVVVCMHPDQNSLV